MQFKVPGVKGEAVCFFRNIETALQVDIFAERGSCMDIDLNFQRQQFEVAADITECQRPCVENIFIILTEFKLQFSVFYHNGYIWKARFGVIYGSLFGLKG